MIGMCAQGIMMAGITLVAEEFLSFALHAQISMVAVDEVCLRLRAEGVSASRYHAGLGDEERRKNQEDFIYDRVDIIAATNAFGMGIDKSNVRFLIH